MILWSEFVENPVFVLFDQLAYVLSKVEKKKKTMSGTLPKRKMCVRAKQRATSRVTTFQPNSFINRILCDHIHYECNISHTYRFRLLILFSSLNILFSWSSLTTITAININVYGFDIAVAQKKWKITSSGDIFFLRAS